MELTAPRAQALTLAWLEPAGVWLYGFLVVALVAANEGGFEATTWGWCAVVTFWLAATGLLVRDRIDLRVLDLTFVAGLLAFTGWVALSNLWTPSVTSTMHEVQRDLAYVGVVVAGLVLVRRRTTHALLGGVLAAIVLLSLYSLGTRLLPDRFGEFDSETYRYRLATPITYWNGLGIFVVTGIVLALGFALRGRTLVARALAAATLPLLVPTMFFTFSRATSGSTRRRARGRRRARHASPAAPRGRTRPRAALGRRRLAGGRRKGTEDGRRYARASDG